MTKKLTNKQGDALPLTRETIRSMRPVRDVDPDMLARLHEAKRARGRPEGRTKSVISLSLDKDIIDSLRQSGQGWQSRVNALLRTALGLHNVTVKG